VTAVFRSLAFLVSVAFLFAAPAGTAGPVAASPWCAPFESASDDAGSGRDATESSPVAIAEGTYEGCIGNEESPPFAGSASDFYTFGAVAGHRYDLTVDRTGCGRFLVWISNAYAAEDQNGGDGCGALRVAYVAKGTGTHTVHLWRIEGNGAYRLTLAKDSPEPRFCPTPQDDGGTGQDAASYTGPWLAAGAFTGCLDRYDDEDDYRIDVPKDHRLVVRFESDDCRVRFHAGLETYTGIFVYGCGPHEIDLGRVHGTYHVTARTTDEIGTAYRFAIALHPLAPRACLGIGDGGTSWDTSRYGRVHPLGFGGTTGCIDDVDHEDAYVATLDAGEHAILTIRTRDCRPIAANVESEGALVVGYSSDDPCAVRWRLLGEAGANFMITLWRGETEGVYDVTLEREATGCPSLLLAPPIARGVPEPACFAWLADTL